MEIKRVFLIILDSVGIGGASDVEKFGDDNPNTLKTIATSKNFDVPNLKRLGLFNIDGNNYVLPEKFPIGAFARVIEASQGKDTTIGHWEIAGIISDFPLPTYPEGFPPKIISELEKSFGRKILCNKPYSGTQVIRDFGREHEKTGNLIVYTSADSVLQIAAHENIVPIEKLYDFCRKAREISDVGRIIARPFIGKYPNYERTPRRHDFSLKPPQKTILDALKAKNLATIGVGKIFDIFAGQGLSKSLGVNENNSDGMKKTLKLLDEDFCGLCFVNLVDFDMKYGHRRDIDGYAQAMTIFDAELGEFLSKMRSDDVLMITADHGCDPAAKGTDHTRENVPLIIYGKKIRSGVNLGVLNSFSDIAATISDIFGVEFKISGKSFLKAVI